MPDQPDAAPYDLLEPEYDLVGGGPVIRSFLICSTPRSGSTLLAEAMHRTGSLAVPAEYLEVEAALPYLFTRWGCDGFEDYVGALHRHRANASGLFGVKAHWHQLLQFSNLSQGRQPFAEIEFPVIAGVLNRVAPQPSFIFVTRRDKARQAVSHWVANKTKQFVKLDDDPLPEFPEYSFDEINAFTEGINLSEESWNRFFTLAGVAPLQIVYEDLVADYESTVRTAARFVGGELAAINVRPPRMRRQSNHLSAEYAERYRQDLGV